MASGLGGDAVPTSVASQSDRPRSGAPNLDSMTAQTVLIVDRDPDTREILALALAHGGYRPVALQEGAAALSLLDVEPVSLVITELYLPCAGEKCLVRAIRRHPVHRDVPVIAYTARAAAADREWAERGGCTLFLAKPMSIADLLDRVRTLVRPEADRHSLSTES